MTTAVAGPAVADDAAVADRIMQAGDRIIALGESAPRPARDAVNLAMINNWVEALGDTNEIYLDATAAAAAGFDAPVAPPAMIQVWTMAGLHGQRTSDDPLGLTMSVLDAEGFTSVVATNCEQVYHRYLRHGEQLTVTTRLESIIGPKRTGLGEGWFVTTRNTWYAGDEPVAEMLFRVLKFRPSAKAAPSGPGDVLRPVISVDTEFFWAGAHAGELRIQRCTQCGVLRHPPGPMCRSCGADDPGYVLAAGTGTVYSYVVHHHPPVPGKTLPFVVALVELDEGVRMLGEVRHVDPADVAVGMAVEVEFVRVDDDLTLPMWRPAGFRLERAPAPESIASDLPELLVEASPTFVVSTALATRDFQDVHHDRDAALARGSADIFVNILTDTGLVQRFVTDWAGPQAVIHSIAIRLGVPCYAYDTLSFTGQVLNRNGDEFEVAVRAVGALGDHITGTVLVTRPGGAP